MIIPIGHEEETVRRLPWVTFGVMIACCAAFVLSGEAGNTAERNQRVVEKALPAVEYYLSHPYLEIDPDLERAAFGDDAGHSERVLEIYREGFPEPSDSEVLRREQQRLDELTAEALAGLKTHPYLRWGLVPSRPTPVTLVSHMFLHGGLLHLLGNLLILYLAGPFIEDVWGRPLYTGFYFCSGLVAALLFIVFNADSGVPMIGASGAIAGVMGAFVIRYWSTKIKFFYMIGLFWRGTFLAPAWVMLPLWFGEQLWAATLTSSVGAGAMGGVAYWAHVGGFAFGVGAALAIRHWQVEERFLSDSLEAKTNAVVLNNPQVERALEVNAAGNAEQAMALLHEEAERNPSNPEVALALWGVATEQQRSAEAAPAMLRVIRGELRQGQPELALTHWTELVQRVPRVEADPDLLLRLAQLLLQQERRDEAASAVRRAMLQAGSTIPASMALRIARLARSVDPQITRGAAQLALARPDLGPLERCEAEQLLASLSAAQPKPPRAA